MPAITRPHTANQVIRAELTGSDTAAACGVTVRGTAPVLDLCRALIEAGFDPDQPLEAWRNNTLCLRVRAIGAAARLAVEDDRFGRPTFRRRRNGVPGAGIAPPVRFPGPSLTPDTLHAATTLAEAPLTQEIPMLNRHSRRDSATAVVCVDANLVCPRCARTFRAHDVVGVDDGWNLTCAGCHVTAIEVDHRQEPADAT